MSDLGRLYEFLTTVNARAAGRTIRTLVTAPASLTSYPRIGERLEEFDPREVRRILVGPYEVRYEVRDSDVVVLLVWHTREHR